MKKLFFLCAAVAMMAVACNTNDIETPGDDPVVFEGAGAITLNLAGDVLATKADNLGGEAYEKVLKETQIFLFNDKNDVTAAAATPRAEEVLYRYETIDGAGTTKTISGIKANRNGGTNYHVLALANYKTLAGNATNNDNKNGDLSTGIRNRGILEGKVVELSMHKTGADGAFPMFGFVENQSRAEVPVNVTAGGSNDPTAQGNAVQATVSLRRFVSRIHLKSVKNEIPVSYGALRIHRVYVLNGYGMWDIAADIEDYSHVGGQYNWSDAPQGSGSYAEQAFYNFGGNAMSIANGATETTNIDHLFYTMPNPTAKADDHFTGHIENNISACTRLVLECSFENDDRGTATNPKIFYYPVTILGTEINNVPQPMKRNASYDISVVIKNEGSDHPNDEPVYGALAVTIEVKDWDDGGDIIKNF